MNSPYLTPCLEGPKRLRRLRLKKILTFHRKGLPWKDKLREAIRVSEPSYSLKYLEVVYMRQRSGEVRTAGESIVVYARWHRLKDETLLKQIAECDEADSLSTLLA